MTREPDTRYLYDVIVMNPRKEDILQRDVFFGSTREEALMNVDTKSISEKHNIKSKDLSIIIIELGEVKIPVKPYTEVKILDKEDD